MSCNVSTGRYVDHAPGEHASGCGPVGKVSSSHRVLFAQEEPYNHPYSALVDVEPGRMYCFDAYQIPDGMHIYLNRIILGYPGPGSCCGGMCPEPIQMTELMSGTQVLYWKRMDLVDPATWIMGGSAPQRTMLYLAAPGTYQFELEDASMLDTLYMEYTSWPHDKIEILPTEYQGGVKCEL